MWWKLVIVLIGGFLVGFLAGMLRDVDVLPFLKALADAHWEVNVEHGWTGWGGQ